MKFQAAKFAIFGIAAALSLSAMSVVGAGGDPCATAFSINTLSISCPTPTPEPTPVPTLAPTAEPAQPVNYEENVTFNDTDLGVALFKSTDEDGNPTMDFYKVETGNTNSTFLFSVTQAEIAPYITNLPAVNTLLESGDGVAVYVLTTGEIQVNAGPDAEGKIHVKIFNGIPWTKVYGYTIDPVK